ncbi:MULTISPECIES: helix-turn-helix transcriptional regulator [unclassified Adlercreutzia]|uniref:helix-turn-helix domain-containing protein n=1 Tax=unclassified Adlercreutzia TaxID=2636013 RepID=UPI0013EDDAA4|nr:MULTISPECIES: helix-turn-helix transcriptional regulator [unclassified Adlercreutzia]
MATIMLTFRGFLLKYCQELAGAQTSSLKKLFAIAKQGRPRVFEPLLLLALCDHREGYLMKQAVGSSVFETYRSMTASFHQSGLALERFLDTLPERSRYKRPLIAWRAENARKQTNRQTLQRVADSLAMLLEQKGISRAEACRITGLNKGNFYAFLKGDASKLSRSTAMRAYGTLRSLPSSPPSQQVDRAATS